MDNIYRPGEQEGRSSRNLVCEDMSASSNAIWGIPELKTPPNPQKPLVGDVYRVRMVLTCNMNHVLGDFVVIVGKLGAFSPSIPVPIVSSSRRVTRVELWVLDREPTEEEKPVEPEEPFVNPFMPVLRKKRRPIF